MRPQTTDVTQDSIDLPIARYHHSNAHPYSPCSIPEQYVAQESDGAVPLEQRTAELVRHRDGLAEAVLTCDLDVVLLCS